MLPDFQSLLVVEDFTVAILGVHMSTAGGYDQAVVRAKRVGCDCLQVFVNSPRAWPRRGLESEMPFLERALAFRRRFSRSKLTHPVAHGSYLINLASPDSEIWKKSIDALLSELQCAEALGLESLIVHPGAHTTSTERAGIRRIGRALNEVAAQTQSLAVRLLLETTAGQGTALGWKFEQLAGMFDATREPDRFGICFDTCHVYAAGYPLAGKQDYRQTFKTFDQLLGLNKIEAFHLNDSQRELGSRVDRHANIGHGEIGVEGFRQLMQDLRFRQIPMFLETPKGKIGRRDADRANLAQLRALFG